MSKNTQKQVSPRIVQFAAAIREAEALKAQRKQCADDSSLSASSKGQRLAELDNGIFMTEHLALMLMQQEIQSCGDSDKNEESAEYFQWTDPKNPEEAFQHVQGILPILDEMKTKMRAVELDPKITLREKAERLAEMKEAVEFVSRRVVALSEAWLEAEAA